MDFDWTTAKKAMRTMFDWSSAKKASPTSNNQFDWSTANKQQEDVMSSPLLDLIGSKEAPKGYNQIYGKDKEAPLDTMTVDEVLSFQKRMVEEGSPSSAVGRYQFINKTLADLKETVGLEGTEKFTPELQDKLARKLLERRGYDKFLKGELSREEFANNLAKEWASLPVTTGDKAGRSYYAGDGLNKALVDVDSVLEALDNEQQGGRNG